VPVPDERLSPPPYVSEEETSGAAFAGTSVGDGAPPSMEVELEEGSVEGSVELEGEEVSDGEVILEGEEVSEGEAAAAAAGGVNGAVWFNAGSG
jgi:hypothetical protein